MTNNAALDALNTIIIYSKMPWNGQENMQGEFNDAVETIRTALTDAPSSEGVRESANWLMSQFKNGYTSDVVEAAHYHIDNLVKAAQSSMEKKL